MEYETFFRNFTRVKLPVPFLSIKLSPYPCFLGIRQYANMGAGKAMKAKTWVQPLNKKIADLYDSFEMFSFAAEPPPLEHQRNEPRMQPVPPASLRKLTVPMYQPRPEPGTVFSRY